MLRATTNRQKRPSEDGYILVAVIFMLAILILSLAVALPRVREDIQRDREVETMHRGKQYVRAIQLYYRKFGSYPPSVDALVKTNDIRFLRKRYIDPITGKDDWKPILYGQNKTPMAMGFFGQPLPGTPLAGIGPSGGNGLTGAAGTTGGFGSSNDGSSGGGNGGFSLGGSGTSTGTDTGSGTGTGAAGSTGAGAASGGTDASGTSTAGSGLGTSPGGQTFGGAGIIGFSPASPKQSILVYKKKNHYNEWEFLYSPLSDQKANSTGITGGTGVGSGGIGGIGGVGGVSNPVTTTPTPTGPTDPTAPTSTAPPQ